MAVYTNVESAVCIQNVLHFGSVYSNVYRLCSVVFKRCLSIMTFPIIITSMLWVVSIDLSVFDQKRQSKSCVLQLKQIWVTGVKWGRRNNIFYWYSLMKTNISMNNTIHSRYWKFIFNVKLFKILVIWLVFMLYVHIRGKLRQTLLFSRFFLNLQINRLKLKYHIL